MLLDFLTRIYPLFRQPIGKTYDNFHTNYGSENSDNPFQRISMLLTCHTAPQVGKLGLNTLHTYCIHIAAPSGHVHVLLSHSSQTTNIQNSV